MTRIKPFVYCGGPFDLFAKFLQFLSQYKRDAETIYTLQIHGVRFFFSPTLQYEDHQIDEGLAW